MLGEHLVAGDQLLGPENDLRALEELCKTTTNESQRSAMRRSMNTPVTIKPGNAREREAFKVVGKLRDLSNTGCGVLTNLPITVGDVFWLEVNNADVGLGNLFARCVRCRMINDQSFENGFTFLSKPERVGSAGATHDSLL